MIVTYIYVSFTVVIVVDTGSHVCVSIIDDTVR